jgi:DNA-binding transcriptional LysR family regulator
MHLRTLELFCSVAEFRSFSRAAMEFDITQSAVSQAMHQLEESVGSRLLDRSRRPLELTAAGEVYLAGVQKLLRGYQRLEDNVRSLGGHVSGRLTIGAIYSIGSTYMPAAREEFRLRQPDVQVRFEYGSSECVAEMVETGEIDFGLVSYPQNTRRLRCIPWLQEPMRVICSSGHRFARTGEVDLKALNNCELVGFESSLRVRRKIDGFLAQHNVNVDVTMEFDNIDSIIRCVQANSGVTILPEAAVRKECADGSLRVVACKQMRLTRPLAIVVRKNGKLTAAADEFVSLLLGRSIDSVLAAKTARKPTPQPSGSKSVTADSSLQSDSSPVAGGTHASEPPKLARASVVA